MLRALLLAVPLNLLLAPALAAQSETPEAKGLAIALDAESRSADYGDLSATAVMRVLNGRGGEARRDLVIRLLDKPGAASKSLTVVDSPRDVKGTALLTHTAADTRDEQWLWLPAVSRVKRIASSGRSGPFMGSEFSYEDFSAQTPERYHFVWLRVEPCPPPMTTSTCDVVQRTPKTADTGYSRQEAWLDQAHRRLHRVDYFDTRNQRLKTLRAQGYTLYSGKYWRPTKLTMTNERSQAVTELRWDNIRFKTGLTDADFEVSKLGSARP